MKYTFVFTLLFLSLFIFINDAQSESAKEANKELIGRWVRPDGGYILFINAVNDNGSIDAEYFNPGPINVSKAQVSSGPEKANIFVELRDVGYPGSYYTLVYAPDSDQLAGVYHNLVLKQNYDIYFVRE